MIKLDGTDDGAIEPWGEIYEAWHYLIFASLAYVPFWKRPTLFARIFLIELRAIPRRRRWFGIKSVGQVHLDRLGT